MVSSSQSQGNIRFPVRDYPSIRENFHVIDSRSKVKRDSTVADQKVNAQKVTHFWKILKILGPKIRKIDQKVTHFHEFSGTQNVSLFDQSLYNLSRPNIYPGPIYESQKNVLIVSQRNGTFRFGKF